jgi:hypothetical protein
MADGGWDWLPSAICHLPSAIRPLPSALCHPPSAIRLHAVSVISSEMSAARTEWVSAPIET